MIGSWLRTCNLVTTQLTRTDTSDTTPIALQISTEGRRPCYMVGRKIMNLLSTHRQLVNAINRGVYWTGEPSLLSGAHLNMTDVDDIDNVSQLPECVGVGDPGLSGLSGKNPPESRSPMAVSDFASDVDSESGGPSLPMGIHSDMTDFDDIDSVSQMTECIGLGDLGLPCSSGKIPPESRYVTAMSDFASVVDSEPNEPSLPSVHLDMPDCADSDSVSQVSDCVNFGKPRSATTSPESGCVTALSDFAGDVDSEPDEHSLLSGVHLDMPDCAHCDSVSQVSDCVNFGKPRSGTTSPESGWVTVLSDFAGDVDSEPDEPSLPSGGSLSHAGLCCW